MAILLIPLALAVIGIIVFFSYKKAKKRLDNISNVERSTIPEIRENHEHFLTSFGAGTFQHYVEISGVVKCDQPLISPISGSKCVSYDYSVVREYEETIQERNNEGKMVARKVTSSETLSAGKKDVPFDIEDEGNLISVLPEKAKIYSIDSANSHSSSLNRDLIDKLSLPTSYGKGRTTGFSITEKVIPLYHQLYVIGEANDRNGKLAISLPRDKEQSFIISTSSEDVLKDKLSSSVKWSKIGFIALFVATAISLIICLLKIM